MSSPTPYFQDGPITIYHADNAEVLPTVDPDDVDLLLTDPPYGINHRVAAVNYMTNISNRRIGGDDKPFDPTPLLQYRQVGLWGGDRYSDRLPVGGWLVWDKTGGGKVNPLVQADAEMMWHNMSHSVDVFRYLWAGHFRAGEHNAYGLHPTQKPVSLMRWILDKWTEPGDLILDPYMGSGPIAQACFEMGRRYIGVEIVEEYCATTVERRLAQPTLI